MADSNPDIVNLLRTSLTRWDQYLRKIYEPDDVFQEKRNKISDQSKKRLEEFALNPPNDNITILQQALLSDDREIERLELEHAAMKARKLKLQGEAAEGVAGRILGDLVDILGLPVMQRLASGLLPAQQEQGATSKLLNKSDCHSTAAGPAVVIEEGSTPSSKYYNTRSRSRLCQRTPTASNIPAGEGKGADDTEAAKPKTADTKTIAILQRNSDKAAIQKPCTTQQSKDIRFAINGQAARIMVRWDAVRLLWVCAVHFPQGQATPAGLDIMVRRSVIPTFIRLVGRRQVENRLEYLTTASEDSQPSSGGCRLSQSSGEESNKNISNPKQN
ncbi:hypothetical protein BHE90_009566 [Fusarium euwallaceae]|uniref:Uncharacterized protein n=1 Tax=Fusarium euwallaceae TaxID=1147111 RepID=A0A430LJT9_9HYPO|nr:hypothetical protein BHE90_009551 [Fusarium euwallaceae]RTE75978.1 hypothetical protein BHE90_009566 [Fusarium euwallaceae]